MISAGHPDAVNRDDQKKTTDLLCGPLYHNADNKVKVDDKCVTASNTAIENGFNQPQPMTGQQSGHYDEYLGMGRGWINTQCFIELGFNPKRMTTNDRQRLVSCMAEYVNNDKEIEHKGKKMKFRSEYIPWAAEHARLGGMNPEDIDVPLPKNLQDYIDTIKGIDNGFFAREARRLFREGIARIRPPSHELKEKFEAGESVGAQVIDEVDKHVKDFVKAGEDKTKQQAERDKTINTFVSATDKKTSTPPWKLTFGILPAVLVPPGTPAPLAQSLRRLYAQAVPIFIQNGGSVGANGAPDPSLAEQLAAAVKGLGITNPDDLNSALMQYVVSDVPVNGGKATSVALRNVGGAGGTGGVGGVGHAPPELINRLDAGTDPAKQTAIDYVWEQVTQVYNKNKIKITPAIESKLVDALAPADRTAGPNNLHGRSALDIARQSPAVNTATNQIQLVPAPANVFSSIDEAIKRRGSGSALATPSTGEVELIIRIHEHYRARLKEAQKPGSKVKPTEVADKLAVAVEGFLFPGGRNETSANGAKRLEDFMNMESFYDSDGNIKWRYKDGNGSGDGPKGEKDGTFYSLRSSLWGGVLTGSPLPSDPGAKPGSGHVMTSDWIGFEIGKRWGNFSLALNMQGLYFQRPNGINAVGGPHDDRMAVSSQNDEGGVSIGRINGMSVVPKIEVKSDDGSSFGFSFPLGLTGARPQDALEDFTIGGNGSPAVADSSRDVATHSQPLVPVSSAMLGIRPTATVKGAESQNKGEYSGEKHNSYVMQFSVPLGSALTGLSTDYTGAEGWRTGVDGSLAVFLCSGDCALKLAGAVQWTGGTSDPAKDQKEAVPDNNLAYFMWLVGLGGEIAVDRHAWISAGGRVGGINQRSNNADSNPDFLKITGMAGGHFPINPGDDIPVVASLDLSYSVNSGKKTVAGRGATDGSGAVPGCEPGFDCSGGPAVDYNQGTNPSMSYGLDPFFTMGERVFVIAPSVSVQPASWFLIRGGVNFIPASDHMRREWKTAVIPNATVTTTF